MSECTLLDSVFDRMEAEGFVYTGFVGRVGAEILTFKNKNGEIRTIKHGFTTAKPRNIRVKI